MAKKCCYCDSDAYWEDRELQIPICDSTPCKNAYISQVLDPIPIEPDLVEEADAHMRKREKEWEDEYWQKEAESQEDE
jgi:hypothetical protein